MKSSQNESRNQGKRIGKTAGGRAAATRLALLGSVAMAPVAGHADTCTPSPPAPTATPLTITCQADASPLPGAFSYGTGPHLVTVADGNFGLIDTGAGEDVVEVLGGSATDIQTGADGDRVIVNGGTIGTVDTGDGVDVIELNNGFVSIRGGNGADDIRLGGGFVNSVFADAGDDTVVLDGSVGVFKQVQGGAGLDRLTLTGTGTLDALKIFGFESLELRPGSDWTTTPSGGTFSQGFAALGGSTFEVVAGSVFSVGNLLVQQDAVLKVDGRFEVAAGSVNRLDGTLTGTGEVRKVGSFGTIFGSTSVIRPGSSIGTLTINSDIAFDGGSRLIAEIDPAAGQTADLLAVGGPVIGLDDLTIEVQPARPGVSADAYVAGSDYVVLTGTLDGDNPTLVQSGAMPALLQASVAGSPSADGRIAVAFTKLPATALPTLPAVTSTGSRNHASLVSAVAGTSGSTLLSSGSTVDSALSALTGDELARFNTVHAEPYSSHLTVGLETLDLITNAVLDHASGIGFPVANDTPWGNVAVSSGPGRTSQGRGWASVIGTRGDVDAENGLGDFDYDLFSLVGGVDLIRRPEFTGGVFIAGSTSEMSEHDLVDQELETDAFSFGAYGRYHFGGGLQLSGALGYMVAETESERENANLGSFTGGTARSDFDSDGWFAGLKVHQSFERAEWVLTPSAALTYALINQDAISETGGGDFNYDIDSASADALVTSIGIDVSRPVVSGDVVWSPVGILRYEYDWYADADEEHDIVVSSPIFGAFEQVGQNRGPQGVLAGLGFTYERSERISVGAGYLYAARSNGEEHKLAGNITMRW